MRSHSWLALLVVLLWSTLSHAATLTEAQYQALNVDVTVTHAAEFAADVANAEYGKIADAYNLLGSPAFWVWRSSLGEKEVYEATVEGASWSWQTYKSQTVQDRDSWARMWGPGVVNPSLKQTRDGWLAIFGGQGASQVQVNYLLTLARRLARRAEVLFATTTAGNGSPATPANLVFEGQLTYGDINHALTGAPLP